LRVRKALQPRARFEERLAKIFSEFDETLRYTQAERAQPLLRPLQKRISRSR
jgi:hypothetical protein